MQYKIPQEVDIEDKIIGPFTLKGFGFVFVAVITAIIFAVILTKTGLGLFPALIIGAFFGSFFLIIGFVPFNGRPAYTFALPLLHFFIKPRQRVWKKELNMPKKNTQETETKQVINTPETRASVKQPLSSVEKQIEEISLTVDTGGVYGSGQTKTDYDQTNDMFDKSGRRIEQELDKARPQAEIKNKNPEPTISEIASVDPKKKFKYEHPDTSKYKIDEKLNQRNK